MIVLMIRRFSAVTQEDIRSYQDLMSSHSENVDKKAKHQAKQQRFKVSKHFLMTKGPERLHFFLRSRSSELILDQQEKADLVEHFKDVHCVMQEGLLYTIKDGREAKMQPDGRLRIASTESTPEIWLENTHPSLISRQLIRQLDAEKAVYYYSTEDLFANKVKVSRYIAKGQNLQAASPPFILLMKGQASGIQMSFSDRTKPFKAQGLQATFQDQGKGL